MVAAHDEASAPASPRRSALAMVLKGYPRISETFISNEIRGLEELGFDIHIVSMRKPRENFSHASVKHIKAPVAYLPESMVWGLPRLLWHNLKFMLREPKNYWQGVQLMLSRFKGAPKKHTWLKHFLQGGYMAEKVLKSSEIGHIHAHFAHTPTSVALYAAKLSGLPFSFTAHAKDIYTQNPARTLEKLQRAAFAVTCTGYNKNHLDQLSLAGGGKRSGVHTVYHGIDLSLFSENGRSTEAGPPYSIMSVARFVEKKGLPTVLRALRILKDRGLRFTYSLVGDGKDKRALRELIRELDLTDEVVMTGTVTHEEVLKLYAKADLFVLGCREAADGDRDGIPNVVAESMAMGVPVAATDVSGLPELVEHEATGLLAPCETPEALALNMERLLLDNELRARIIPAARSKVEAVFDNRLLIRDLGAIFHRETGLGPDIESSRLADWSPSS